MTYQPPPDLEFSSKHPPVRSAREVTRNTTLVQHRNGGAGTVALVHLFQRIDAEAG